MYDWPQITKHERSGTIDETVSIKAVAGFVELHFSAMDDYGGGEMTLRIPTEAVGAFVAKLEAARDAAALMKSANQ